MFNKKLNDCFEITKLHNVNTVKIIISTKNKQLNI